MIVTILPPFSWALFSKQLAKHRPVFPLDQARIRLYYRASNAIWNAVKLLSLSPGDTILFPAYHCGLELDAILKAGARVNFYPVNRDTTIDPEVIRASITEKTKAVYVIHYFGFSLDPAPIVEICRQSGLLLIEDCTHALYSRSNGQPIGINGDLSIFSMWKTVPIPFGGALLVNSKTLPLPDESVRPDHDETWRVMMKLLAKRLMRLWVIDRVIRKAKIHSMAWVVRVLQRDPVDLLDFCLERGAWGIPPISRRMLFGVDEQEVVQLRRRHFQTLCDVVCHATHLRPLFESLPDGVCPLLFPVLVDDSRRFSNYMQSQGVNTRLWERHHPQFPSEEHADATFLKSHVVALPVHQCLRRSDIELMCKSLLAWEREENARGQRHAA